MDFTCLKKKKNTSPPPKKKQANKQTNKIKNRTSFCIGCFVSSSKIF